MSIKIGINGFGRIGKLVSRFACETNDIEIVHINDKMDIKLIAHLLKYDSAHGKINQEIKYQDNYLFVDNKKILITNYLNLSDIPWDIENVDIVVDSSGQFKTHSLLEKHLFNTKVKKVILSCPADDISIKRTIVMGVNHQEITNSDVIISNASCTTNCVAIMLKVLKESFGINRAFMNTVHPATNNQNLLDGFHTDFRRARSAFNNIIPTSTSAIRTVEFIMPELEGKFDGFATRVPVQDGSFVELTAQLSTNTTVEEINNTFKQFANGSLVDYLDYCDVPIVSSDINNNNKSAIFDSLSTKVLGGDFIQILAWYDNEAGYSSRIIDLIKHIYHE